MGSEEGMKVFFLYVRVSFVGFWEILSYFFGEVEGVNIFKVLV